MMTAGLRVFESPLLTKKVLFRHCKSKRRRIVKKWAKNPKNWREEPDRAILVTPHGVFCHPVVADQIRRMLTPETGVHSSPFGGFGLLGPGGSW